VRPEGWPLLAGPDMFGPTYHLHARKRCLTLDDRQGIDRTRRATPQSTSVGTTMPMVRWVPR
jgi:hypothetical protein